MVLAAYAKLTLCSGDSDLRVDTTDHVRSNCPHEIILASSEHGIGRNTKPADSPPGQDWSQITLEWVSGKHCLFRALEPSSTESLTVTISDMSSNGTYVNGVKLVKGTASALRHGDKIHVFRPKTKKTMNQLILYQFEMLEVGSSSARAEAWRNKHDATVPASSKGEVMEQVQLQVAKLTRSNESLRADIDIKQKEMDEMSNKLRDFKQEAAKTRLDLESNMTEENSRLKLIIQQEQDKLGIAETTILELKSEVTRLESEGENVSSRHGDAALQIKSLEEDAAAMELRYSEQAATLRKVREVNAANESVMAEVKEELGQLKESAQTNESARKELLAKMEELELSYRRQCTVNEELETAMEASNKKVKMFSERELATQAKLRDFDTLKDDLDERSASLTRQKLLYTETATKLETERSQKEKLVLQLRESERKLVMAERNGDKAEKTKSLVAEVTALSASEQQQKKLATEAQETVQLLKYDLEAARRHLQSAELAADASREQCSTLQLRLAQAFAALGLLESSEERRRKDWLDITSRMHFQLVGLDQSTESSSIGTSQIKKESAPSLSHGETENTVRDGVTTRQLENEEEEEPGCTQMDSPVKSVKRRFTDTLDSDSVDAKRPFLQPQTQMAELDDVSDDEATQNEKPALSSHVDDNEDDDETQAELRCSRHLESTDPPAIVLMKSLSNNDAQVDSVPALSIEMEKPSAEKNDNPEVN